MKKTPGKNGNAGAATKLSPPLGLYCRVIALVLVGGYVVANWEQNKRIDDWLMQANVAERRGIIDEARRRYEQVLALRPEDSGLSEALSASIEPLKIVKNRPKLLLWLTICSELNCGPMKTTQSYGPGPSP